MQDNCYLCLWDTKLKYHLLKKTHVFASLPIEMDPKQNYTNAYVKDR